MRKDALNSRVKTLPIRRQQHDYETYFGELLQTDALSALVCGKIITEAHPDLIQNKQLSLLISGYQFHLAFTKKS